MLGWELKDTNNAYKEALYGATRPFDYSSFENYPLSSNLQKDFLDRNSDNELYYQYDNKNFYNSAVFFDTVNHKVYATLLFDNGQSAIERYRSDDGTTFTHWSYAEANGTSSGGSEDCYIGASMTKTLYSGSTYIYHNYLSSNISSVESDLNVFTNAEEYYNYITNTYEEEIGWHSVESITGKLGTFNLTKIFEDYINDGEEVTNAEITNFDTGDDSIVSNLIKKAIGNDDVITVYYNIPDNDYQYIKLIYKKDDEPDNETDGTIIDILNEPTKCNISTITESGVYWFKIFTDKDCSEPYIFEFDYKNPIPPDLSYITKVNDMYFRRIDLYTCYMANQNVDSWFKDYTLVSGKIIMNNGGTHYDYHDAEHSVGSGSYVYDPYVSFFSPKMTITVTTNNQGATVSYSSGDYYMPRSSYNNRYKMCIGNTNGNPPVDNKIYAAYSYEYGYDPYSFLQSSFESLADAIYYIYSHYSNINLYVNGVQWIEARS